MSGFRPMLANPADFSILRFPVLASRKLDGIRMTVHNGVGMSRSMKPIPNAYVQAWVKEYADGLDGLDGELIVGPPNIESTFRTTTSHVMSHDKTGFDFTFFAFDIHNVTTTPYWSRLNTIRRLALSLPRLVVLVTTEIHDQATLDAYEVSALEDGFEGVMVRDPNGFYKQGRSTARGQELLKVKRSVDAEAVVVGIEERMHNGNVAFTNELGRTARSSHQDGKVGMGTMGALSVLGFTGDFANVDFSIGTGFDDAQRAEIWADKEIVGKIVKFKYCPIGTKDKPRHPVFLGFRDARDMDAAA